jgi:hypothetical protein
VINQRLRLVAANGPNRHNFTFTIEEAQLNKLKIKLGCQHKIEYILVTSWLLNSLDRPHLHATCVSVVADVELHFTLPISLETAAYMFQQL